jgi:hypothetical protein
MGITYNKDDPELSEIVIGGQQKSYLVLNEEERQKGFIRPVRYTYRHEKCGTETTMGLALAETYARDPHFYTGTFCVYCGKHFPLLENNKRTFYWLDGQGVGE